MADWRNNERVKPDPTVSVADLETALDRFFRRRGYRDLQEIVDQIKNAGVKFSSRPKEHY